MHVHADPPETIVVALSSIYELQVYGGQRAASVTAEVYHVTRNDAGGSVSVLLGWLVATFKPWEAEQRAHWACFLNLWSDCADGEQREERAGLAQLAFDWICRTRATTGEPVALCIQRCTHQGILERGGLLDD